MTMPAAEINKLAKICALFGSDKSGERATAAWKAHEIVQKWGKQWADILYPSDCLEHDEPPPRPSQPMWHDDLDLLFRFYDYITPWERNFASSISGLGSISPKQQAVLVKIVQSLRNRGFI